MTYSQFLNELRSYAEEDFAKFQRRLIFTKYEILGVRTPTLRKLAAKYMQDWQTFFQFPNEYYEVVFVKLTMISHLPYLQFIQYVGDAVLLMDNWALCDSFKAKCMAKNRKAFLPELEKIFLRGGEYDQRYVLVVLLAEYIEKDYFPQLEDYIRRADTSVYYIHMAVAWLVAELLIKEYDFGLALLNIDVLDVKTYNKAIQKALESYRLTTEQKEYLRSLKIKTNK